MSFKERDFSEDVKVNKYKLPEECEQHAGLYHYWSDKLAGAKDKLNQAEDQLKLALAETELDIRENWDDYSEAKMTENGVKATLETADAIVKAKAKRREAQHLVDTLYVAQSAMDHRRDMLNNLTKLTLGGFFAAPESGKREGVTEQTSRDVRKNMNKEKTDG